MEYNQETTQQRIDRHNERAKVWQILIALTIMFWIGVYWGAVALYEHVK